MPYCESCGTEIESGQNYCRNCGGAVSVKEEHYRAGGNAWGEGQADAQPTPERGWSAASAEPSRQGQAYQGGAPHPDIPPPISGFSWHWGGFLIGWLWSFWHGMWWVGLLMIACWFIPYVGLPASLGLKIWLGVEGWRMAWRNRRWSSTRECIDVQRSWMIWGIVWAVLVPIMALVSIVAITLLGGNISNILESIAEGIGEPSAY